MNLNETEFLTLKSEQSLLVDFQSFPSKLTELLELCLNNQVQKEDKVKYLRKISIIYENFFL